MKKRGLGSADMQTRKRVASIGGKAAHNRHVFTSSEASKASRLRWEKYRMILLERLERLAMDVESAAEDEELYGPDTSV